MKYCLFFLFFKIFLARPSLWDIEFANQLSMSINHQPRNGLEEMIQWTKEGKLWQYPINNEDGGCYTEDIDFCLLKTKPLTYIVLLLHFRPGGGS